MLVHMGDVLFFVVLGLGFFAWLLVHGAHQRIDKLTARVKALEDEKNANT